MNNENTENDNEEGTKTDEFVSQVLRGPRRGFSEDILARFLLKASDLQPLERIRLTSDIVVAHREQAERVGLNVDEFERVRNLAHTLLNPSVRHVRMGDLQTIVVYTINWSFKGEKFDFWLKHWVDALSVVIETIIKIIVNNPPMALIVLTFLLIILGHEDWAGWFLGLGVLLQVLSLVLRRRRE